MVSKIELDSVGSPSRDTGSKEILIFCPNRKVKQSCGRRHWPLLRITREGRAFERSLHTPRTGFCLLVGLFDRFARVQKMPDRHRTLDARKRRGCTLAHPENTHAVIRSRPGSPEFPGCYGLAARGRSRQASPGDSRIPTFNAFIPVFCVHLCTYNVTLRSSGWLLAEFFRT